ncbi:MAG: nuclease-related domain-containing protein [Pseudomonadota bacterium]
MIDSWLDSLGVVFGAYGLGVVAAAAALIALLVAWLVVRRRRKPDISAELDRLSHDRLANVVLPKSDDGDILIEHILLTDKGLAVVDLRDVGGIVFAGERMSDWTVMDGNRRFTMANPQETLLDRLAAVRQAAPNTPVDGRIVFSDAAQFKKGRPDSVITVAELAAWLPKPRTDAGASLYKDAWLKLRELALEWRD